MSHNDYGGKGFHKRLFSAWMYYQAKHGRVKQAEFGALVAKHLHRQPFTQATISRWFSESEPDLETIGAIADVLGVTRAWLAFGEGPAPETPALPTPQPRRKK